MALTPNHSYLRLMYKNRHIPRGLSTFVRSLVLFWLLRWSNIQVPTHTSSSSSNCYSALAYISSVLGIIDNCLIQRVSVEIYRLLLSISAQHSNIKFHDVPFTAESHS